MATIPPHEFSPWGFWSEADPEQQDAQRTRQRALVDGHPERRLGEQCFVSELASVDHDALRLGDRTYIAAGAYLTGELVTGVDCTINAYTVVRGRVSMGDGVRIGAHTSILGFNHSMEPGTPVFRQPSTSRGIGIGDDVWIGSHVVVLDGVSVGSHSVPPPAQWSPKTSPRARSSAGTRRGSSAGGWSPRVLWPSAERAGWGSGWQSSAHEREPRHPQSSTVPGTSIEGSSPIAPVPLRPSERRLTR